MGQWESENKVNLYTLFFKSIVLEETNMLTGVLMLKHLSVRDDFKSNHLLTF
jgi:hypothetical protein